MKMKKILKMLVALVAIVVTVSCMDESEGNTTWQKRFDGVMTTTNTDSGDVSEDNASVIIYQGDITEPYMNITIEGVRFVPMMPDVDFLVENVQFSLSPTDDPNDPLYHAWVFNMGSVVPKVGNVPREEYTMYNFQGNLTDNAVRIDFDVNFRGVIYHASFGDKAE